jgi:hypothetical protein
MPKIGNSGPPMIEIIVPSEEISPIFWNTNGVKVKIETTEVHAKKTIRKVFGVLVVASGNDKEKSKKKNRSHVTEKIERRIRKKASIVN